MISTRVCLVFWFDYYSILFVINVSVSCFRLHMRDHWINIFSIENIQRFGFKSGIHSTIAHQFRCIRKFVELNGNFVLAASSLFWWILLVGRIQTGSQHQASFVRFANNDRISPFLSSCFCERRKKMVERLLLSTDSIVLADRCRCIRTRNSA